QHYGIAARLYGEALAAEPKLAEDRAKGHRYNAACAASLAAAGKGKDGNKLDDQDRAKLRGQALDWLRAELTAWAKILERDPSAAVALQDQLTHWQTDAALAGVRDDKELSRLPKDEQSAWQELWTDTEKLRKTARGGYTETACQGTLMGEKTEQVH